MREGALDARGDRPRRTAIARCSTRSPACVPIATHGSSLAPRALTGSLTGLGESLDQIADDAEHEAIDTEALRRAADARTSERWTALRDEVGRGTFLREEALRHWQAFVGADQITRFFSRGHRPDPWRDRRRVPARDGAGRRGPRRDHRRPDRGGPAPGGRGGPPNGDGVVG